jgi:hypothetical protein
MQRRKELCERTTFDRGEFILDTLSQFGVDTQVQDFSDFKLDSRKRDFKNIIAKLNSGSSIHKIALAAHYDKTDNGQGALDNGAGVAQLLSVLEKLLSVKSEVDVTFLFFDGEEDLCVGSKYFVKNLDTEFDAVYNVDFTGVGDGIILGESSLDNVSDRYVANDVQLNRRFENICRSHEIEVYRVNTPLADNVPFTLRQIPSTVISTLPIQEAKSWRENGSPWSLPTMKLINGSGDTFDKVDFRTVEMMKGLLYDLVCSYR